MNYLFRFPNGQRLFYALDTGYYAEETWTYLKDRKTDILILEATFGGKTDRAEYPDGHLDISAFIKMLERMTSIGFIDDHTRIFATHINPHQGLSHDELQARFDATDFTVTVAYDGLIV